MESFCVGGRKDEIEKCTYNQVGENIKSFKYYTKKSLV